jgi:hypothetical protein
LIFGGSIREAAKASDKSQARQKVDGREAAVVNFFPYISFDLVPNSVADQKLQEWGHWLGGCNRPFGRQSFGLYIAQEVVAVAVSASTVNKRCGGYKRQDVIELARLCAHPDHRDMTRVVLRLWRKVAPTVWTYWPAKALVSYANAIRHKGDIYRFDGWKKVADVGGSKGSAPGGWNRRKSYDPKSIWVWEPTCNLTTPTPA